MSKMDEINAHIHQQSSISSDSNGEDISKVELIPLPLDKRICLVGSIINDNAVCNAAQAFGVPVITSENGFDFVDEKGCRTVFVLEPFDDDVYNTLFKHRQSILGPIALQQLANKKEKLPDNTRPLYNLAMSGVVLCFTGFRNKDDLTRLVPLVHHMGGSIRKEMSSKVTHLIANVTGGDKYQYAATFRVPVVHQSWVLSSWEQRNDLEFYATMDTFVGEHKLKPFHGARVCFFGFQEDEEKHMTEVLEANGGIPTSICDPTCSHVVVEQSAAEIWESTTDPLSPKPSSDTALLTPTNTVIPSTFASSPAIKMMTAKPSNLLETLYEHNFVGLNNTFSNDVFSTQSLDLNQTNTFSKRKRNHTAILDGSFLNKRRRNLSYNDKTCKRMSNLLITPIEYFSQHRRTINGLADSEDLNISTVSANVTPNSTLDSNKQFNKSIKKNLFTRTFSSAFKKRSKRKATTVNLNVSSESEIGGRDNFNVSCFPDISSCITLDELPVQATTQPATPGPLIHTVVVDESAVAEHPETSSKTCVVKAEWFWTSVQKQTCLSEKEYLFDDVLQYIEQVLSPARRESHQATPSSATRRKRKRLQETLSSLALQPSPSIHKRRSSVSDAGLLSVSGSFLDCTASPDKIINEFPEPSAAVDTPRKGLTARQQVFLELLQTESNYVNILHTIMTMFKKHLEEMHEDEALLNNTELKMIFGNLPPIYETHLKMLEELRWASSHWSEELSIGNIILKYSTDLLKAYPAFVNFFEEMKDTLLLCDANKPRFHAFLKACQTRPECGRQTLQDLLIRPVQRLPSISLLLNDILKNTSKSNSDHSALGQALAALKEVMTHINEDKRKTEGQRVMFDIFNDIDNCPPDLVSSHRSFVTRSEVVQMTSSEGLPAKGSFLVLFLFTDQLEICKKRSKSFNTLKSPNSINGFHQKTTTKPYKHVKLMPLSIIKRVIDIKESEDCQKVFSLVYRSNDDVKERCFSFALTEEDADKAAFLRTLCKQMATNACTTDTEKFLAYLEPQELEIDKSDINNGTLQKAFKFANRTRLKVGRAFSFNKTPSKLKRAVSSMMSPFGSSMNLTPASQLAQMRLASYSNINELGNANSVSDSQPVAPMSVQPTRKLKASSLGTATGAAALKRL